MICPHCAFPNEPEATICAKCQQPLRDAEASKTKPDSSLSLSREKAVAMVSQCMEEARSKEKAGDLRGAFLVCQGLLIDHFGALPSQLLGSLYAYMGRVSYLQGLKERAVKYLKKASSLRPTDATIQKWLQEIQKQPTETNGKEPPKKTIPATPPPLIKSQEAVRTKPMDGEATQAQKPKEAEASAPPKPVKPKPSEETVSPPPEKEKPKEVSPKPVADSIVSLPLEHKPETNHPRPMPKVEKATPPKANQVSTFETESIPSETVPRPPEKKSIEQPVIRPVSPAPIPAADLSRQVWVAGFWIRLLASIIDMLVVTTVVILMMILSSVLLGNGLTGAFKFLASQSSALMITFLIFCFFLLSYWTLFTRFGGQSAGKMLLHLRVVGLHGHSLSTLQAILRAVGMVLATLPGLAGFIWAAFDLNRRGWHDRFGSSLVLRLNPIRGSKMPTSDGATHGEIHSEADNKNSAARDEV